MKFPRNATFDRRWAGLALICLIAGSWGLAAEAQDAIQNEDDWIQLAPSGARATLEMPVQPRFVERSFSPVQGQDPIKVKLHIGSSERGNVSYLFSYHDFSETPTTGKQINDTLDGAVRGSLATVLGQKEDEEKIRFQRYSGRQFTYSFRQLDKQNNAYDFVAISRVYLARNRLYQLTAVMEKDAVDLVSTDAVKFLNSFRIVEPEPDLPPKPRTNK